MSLAMVLLGCQVPGHDIRAQLALGITCQREPVLDIGRLLPGQLPTVESFGGGVGDYGVDEAFLDPGLDVQTPVEVLLLITISFQIL